MMFSRLGRERQQVDQDARCRAEIRRSLLRHVKARTPSMALGLRLQPRTGNSNMPSALATRSPSTPRPITPTGKSARRRGLRNFHCRLAHIGLVGIEFAEVADHRLASRIRPSARTCRRRPAAPPGACGGRLQLEQRIHARADVEQGFERRLLIHELLGRRPDHGVVGLWRARAATRKSQRRARPRRPCNQGSALVSVQQKVIFMAGGVGRRGVKG